MTPALYLGACVDGEANGQPNAFATGDDVALGNPVFGNLVWSDLNKNGIQDDGPASAFSGIAVNMVWAGLTA